MRRYLLLRAAWQAGVLFGFISLAYVIAFVVPKAPFGHDPGYGGFLRDLTRGSLGRSAEQPPGVPVPSVRSMVWDASWVTLSFLLMTGVVAVALGALFAFTALRAPRWRPLVWWIGMIFVSLLPLWTGLYLAEYLGADWHVFRVGGYCSLRASSEYGCHGLEPWLASLFLPAIALGIFFTGVYGRWLAAAFRKGTEEYRRDLEGGREAAEAKRAARRRWGLAFVKLLSRDSSSRSASEPSSRRSSGFRASAARSSSRPMETRR
jgi:hypothetical protein